VVVVERDTSTNNQISGLNSRYRGGHNARDDASSGEEFEKLGEHFLKSDKEAEETGN